MDLNCSIDLLLNVPWLIDLRSVMKDKKCSHSGATDETRDHDS
jgi:hypothetical protein